MHRPGSLRSVLPRSRENAAAGLAIRGRGRRGGRSERRRRAARTEVSCGAPGSPVGGGGWRSGDGLGAGAAPSPCLLPAALGSLEPDRGWSRLLQRRRRRRGAGPGSERDRGRSWAGVGGGPGSERGRGRSGTRVRAGFSGGGERGGGPSGADPLSAPGVWRSRPCAGSLRTAAEVPVRCPGREGRLTGSVLCTRSPGVVISRRLGFRSWVEDWSLLDKEDGA